ncbi:PAS domain S-box protein [Actimicrobium antarcticum]|uniref:PAS domain S-box protein n=2 Tax=Actimicrobium antarcticum TaxID=1051899 RepID=A0ABP7SNM8_9BURK
MKVDELAVAEQVRICALHALAVLDTPQEERFDRLTRLVSHTLSVPTALVSLVAEDRQWFKSRVGLDASETPRSVAFCSHAVASGEMLVVDDATLDPRFVDNPLVTDAPFIRFYAGQPVFSLDGQAVGTLCIIDSVPRRLDDLQKQVLRDFALLVQDELNKTTIISARKTAEDALHALNEALEERINERTRSLEESNRTLKREMQRRELVESTLRSSEQRIQTIIDTSLVAFVSIDTRGHIVDWNPSAEQTFGWRRDEALGIDLATLITPVRFRDSHRTLLQRLLDGASAEGINNRRELTALTKRGDEITVRVTISAFDFDGERYFGAFLYDISEEQKAQRALEEKSELLAQKQELLDAILETVDVGVVACSAEGGLSLFNRAAREFHGLSQESLGSGNWAEHYSLYASDGVALLNEADIPLVRALQGEVLRNVPMVIAPVGLSRRFVLASGRRIANSAGKPLGAVVAMKDITELNAFQRQLARNEQRLRDITDNVPALIAHIDRNHCFTFLNSPALRFYGKSGQNLIGQHLSVIYTAVEFEKFAPLVARVLVGERVDFEEEMQIAGKPRFFQVSYIPDRDDAGEVQGFYVLALDVTARKNSELQQRESEERLRTITDNLPVLIAYIDTAQRYCFANALYRQWLKKDPAAMLGRSVAEVFGEEFHEQRAPYLERCLDGQAVQADFTMTDGMQERTVNTAFIPHIRDGSVIGIYLFSTDVTATYQQKAHLHSIANTDALTSLPNRRSYEASLNAAVRSAQSSGDGIALMYLDIDHFKTINDTWGHAAGDDVLQEFSRRLLMVVRKTDRVSRLAGDEFTILLEGVPTPEVCQRLADKILDAVREPFQVGGQAKQVTTSIGITWNGSGNIDAETLSARADAALYQAKGAGRNQYCSVDTTETGGQGQT